jgi:biopolymer transport protein ExbB/TolQ
MALWMVIVEWLARLILLGLVVLSVWSIAIILDRRKFFQAIDHDKDFEELKTKLTSIKSKDHEKALSRYFFEKTELLQKGLGVLGTLGSTTPFIGLLGTIMGIIVAFGELSNGNAGTNAIMYALAEALILTAIGLFVAIPAVIGFNYFNKKIKTYLGDQKSRLDEYLATEES